MPSPTLSNQIKINLFNLSFIDKEKLNASSLLHYIVDDDNDYMKPVVSANLESNDNSMILAFNNGVRPIILSIWTNDYWNDIVTTNPRYNIIINNKSYTMLIED